MMKPRFFLPLSVVLIAVCFIGGLFWNNFGQEEVELETQECGVRSRAGFPSYCDAERWDVSWDGKSIMLNGERALFLSGSIHAPRLTDWERTLDLAVFHGLNMVQVYVLWNWHQPTRDEPLDFSGHKDVARLMELAGDRGLFVTLRLGPYVCAEWTYGGLPTWLGLEEEGMMEFRTYDERWLAAMRNYSLEVAAYVRSRGLWASQGGPVILAQIENELSIDDDDDPEKGARYVAWCGELARELDGSVGWLMCNGEAANGTINTCNGENCDAFLEANGQNGRVLKDQPALWTEVEQGYQLWGESSTYPYDYFWGDTAKKVATNALRWFARGGSHLNYYMWSGGSNFGPYAAAGLIQAYSVDAPTCSNNLPHQPKFDHLLAMHRALAEVADVMLAAERRLDVVSDSARVYELVVLPTSSSERRRRHLAFAENDDSYSDVDLGGDGECLASVAPSSSLLVDLDTCEVLFDAGRLSSSSMEYRRRDSRNVAKFSAWSHFRAASKTATSVETTEHPVEQSELTAADPTTQYAVYETDLAHVAGGLSFSSRKLGRPPPPQTLVVETSKANGVVLFANGEFVGAGDDREHGEGKVNLTFTLPAAVAGRAANTRTNKTSLVIVSENFGFHNLIGRWGGSRVKKPIGVFGAWLDGRRLTTWRSTPGIDKGAQVDDDDARRSPCVFSEATFDLRRPLRRGATFVLDAASLGRGHAWINGHDIGRFWNVTRDGDTRPSQRYYHLPTAWLRQTGNDIRIFDALGGDPSRLAVHHTAVVPSWTPLMPDDVDSPASCLV